MKRILFFIESLSRGGAEKVLSDIVSNLDKNKFDITVCTVTDEGEYQAKVEKHCHYRSFLRMYDSRQGVLKLLMNKVKTKLIYKLPVKLVYKWFIRDKYDVEIAFVEGFATKLIAASSNPKSKKIAWVHIDMINNPHADKNYSNLQSHIKTYQRYERILCVSDKVKNQFLKKFGIEFRADVQYNPVDSNTIKLLSNDSVNILPTHMPALVTLGRLEQQKGYIRLVSQLGELYKKGYTFSLWILGEGSQRSRLEEIINDYQMNDYVQLLGFHSNPYKYISKCDAFVCSSYAEGFSTAATEALILGKPIFTTDCSGMKELFGDENCGEIIDNTDEALYMLLERLVSDRVDLSQYQAGINHRKAFFGIEQRIKEIEEILDE